MYLPPLPLTIGPWGLEGKWEGTNCDLRPWSPDLGCVAYRDEKGSDFIQTLVEVLRADPKADLLELMTEVSCRVGRVAWGEGLDSTFFSTLVF